MFSSFFFFNDTATTEIYTLSLHDALPIFPVGLAPEPAADRLLAHGHRVGHAVELDRKSTRLNSSHGYISYAVFCLKKKNTSKHESTIARPQVVVSIRVDMVCESADHAHDS